MTRLYRGPHFVTKSDSVGALVKAASVVANGNYSKKNMAHDISIPAFSRLLSHLYDGHLEEDPYSHFLDEVSAVLDLNFASMTLREPLGEDGGLLFISSDKLAKTLIDDHDNPYTDQYYTSDIMSNLPWGKVVTIDELMSYDSFENTELYRICMAPIDIYHMAGIDLRLANGQRFTVRFCRPRAADNFSADDRAFMLELAPHIQRAVANGMQLIQLDSERKLFSSTISGLSIGIVTLDKRSKVVTCNAAADQILRDKDGVSIVNDHLYIANTAAREKFVEYVALVLEAQRDQSPAPLNALAVPRPSGKGNLEILVKPMVVEKNVESADTPHIMLFVSDPERKHEIDIKMLMSLYQLTRAESMLAKQLAAGMTLDQSATHLGIARNTARAQLRSIFAKTGVTQQSLLVSLILKSLATFS